MWQEQAMAALWVLSAFALLQSVVAERMDLEEDLPPLAEKQSIVTRKTGDVIDGRYVVVKELENLPFGYGMPIDGDGRADSFVERSGPTNATKHPVTVDGYQATKRLGVGAYGRAFLVEDKESPGKLVVLKEVLRPTDHWARRSTYKECKLMVDLQRPENVAIDAVGASRLLRCLKLNINYNLQLKQNFGGILGNNPRQNRPKKIVPQYHVPGPQYIIVEYAGRPLRLENLEYEGAIAKQLLQGIRYLARLGYSHRDLKPDNVLIQYLSDTKGKLQPIVTIIDFGLATGDVFCNGGTGDCSVDFRGYHWSPPEMQDSSKSQLAFHHPQMTADAYDLWSLGLILVDQMCSEERGADKVRKERQWKILKGGLHDAMDYDTFFCGTGSIKYGENWEGFWPTVCNILCEDFYQDKRLAGFVELISFALQRNPEKRSFLSQARDLPTLRANGVPQTTYYVPIQVDGQNILQTAGPGKFRVTDGTGGHRGVALRVSKLLDARTQLSKPFGAVIDGKDLGDGWVETKELTPKLGVETLMPLLCTHESYMLPRGESTVISDEEDFEHDSDACKVPTLKW